MGLEAPIFIGPVDAAGSFLTISPPLNWRRNRVILCIGPSLAAKHRMAGAARRGGEGDNLGAKFARF
jgi:hypothetical protein